MNSTEHSKHDRLGRMIQEMKQAKTVQERRSKAIDAILEFRKTTKPISTEEILQIKEELQESIFDGLDSAYFHQHPVQTRQTPCPP